MALVDSKSALRKCCDQYKRVLPKKTETQILMTFSTFVFAVGSPRNQVSEANITKLAESMYGTPILGDVATIRRLHFEPCTYLLNDMKTNVLNTDSSEPLKKQPSLKNKRDSKHKKRGSQGCFTSHTSNLLTVSMVWPFTE